jgi:tRNA (cytidine/uridine-2'-O-)-methyltransferase
MHQLHLALYQPDIPQNAGALLRLAACLGFPLEVIGPCGFLWDDKRMRRAGMDYLDAAQVEHHSGFTAFNAARKAGGRRLVLLTTSGEARLDEFRFTANDVLMVGRESAGVPDEVATEADARLIIPMTPGMRSLNVALAATLAVGEALRQLNGFPRQTDPRAPELKNGPMPRPQNQYDPK